MSRTLPHIPKWRTIRNAPKFLSNPIALMKNNIEQYGDTYSFVMGGHPAIFTADPHFIQHVLQKAHRKYHKSPPHFEKIAKYLGYGLLTIDGQRWRKQRRLIQPGFHKQRIANLTKIMNTVIDEFMQEFDQRIEAGPVDMYTEMQELAFNLVARSIFNLQIDQAELQRISQLIADLQAYVIKEIRTPFLMPWLKLSGQYKRATKLASEADSIIQRFIEERKAGKEAFDDLLQMLLDARYEDNGAPMSPQQLIDEVKILFVAGHDTSGNALSWIWYLLERHPEWIEQLVEEVQQVVGQGVPQFEHLPQLLNTKQVMKRLCDYIHLHGLQIEWPWNQMNMMG